MRERNRKRQRRTAAAAAIALALAMAWGGGNAFAQDEEDVPLDTKLFRQLMKDLGLQRDGEGIDYRERAPLVVPPSRNLPPPQSGSSTSLTANPAWPKDPDVQQRKAEAAARKKPQKTAGETMEEEGRPLSRKDIDRGKVVTGSTSSGSSGSNGPDEDMRWFKDPGAKSIFSDMFSTFSTKAEVGSFTGEPVRETLTAPPAGYQTPSPEQPYGLGAKTNKKKALTLEDRTAGETR
jgi:hypothetical protein